MKKLRTGRNEGIEFDAKVKARATEVARAGVAEKAAYEASKGYT